MGAQDHPWSAGGADAGAPTMQGRGALTGDGVKVDTASGLIGVGYEGRTAEELVAYLVGMDVSRLVDVRLNPISRKPGLSKTALGRALAQAGIVYEHRRELGNPKVNRAGFAGSAPEWELARSRYRDVLRGPEASEALDAVAAAGSRERVAVLCFEAEEYRCHRDVVLAEVRQRIIDVVASRRPRH